MDHSGFALLLEGHNPVCFNIMQGFTVLDSLGIAASVGLDTAVVSIFIILLPVLFLQIFGELPFALLRRRILNTNRSGPLHVDAGGGNVTIGAISLSDPVLVAQAIETGFSIAGVRRLDPRDLLALYAERTSALIKQIYARAGVYLLVGVVISFIGLAFFYVRSKDSPNTTDYADRILSLIPGFGILFFIEFIAFFFLRQYRSAMDEFRYFDTIRRSREESLVILKMFAENSSPVSTKDVLDAMNIYSQAGRLGEHETTDILESRRLQKDEVAIFEKILDVIGTVKDSAKSKDDKGKK